MKKNIKHQIKELEKEFKTAPVPNLDLSNKPHLQKIRQFVNDFTGSKPTPKELQKSPTQKQSLLLEPYLTYQTHERDIIREYRLFPNMVPTQKDHAGRTNYFERKDFQDMINQYELASFPTRWTNGRKNFFNLEYENAKLKKKHNWEISKANYNLIQTHQPNNASEMMTKNRKGDNGFWNESNCFLNTTANIDIFDILNSDIKNNAPYIRFVTKNLEVAFDWFDLIACEFFEFMSLTAKVQQYTEETQYYTAKVQENTGWAQEYTEDAQEYIEDVQRYTAKAQEKTALAQQYIPKAQNSFNQAKETITQLQLTNQPKKITINLTQKTVINYQTNSTKQVPYCEVNYDLFELITFINKLDLSNKPHLQKIRQFVNDFTGKSNKSNTPPTLIQNNDFM
ncbi:hypothetical protein PSOLA_05720 [Candidatus Phytoplasma solani]